MTLISLSLINYNLAFSSCMDFILFFILFFFNNVVVWYTGLPVSLGSIFKSCSKKALELTVKTLRKLSSVLNLF